MNRVTVPKGTKLLSIGDIHEHEEQFNAAVSYVESSSDPIILVSVGDIYDRGFGTPVAESIVDTLQLLHEDGKAYVIRGNHELKRIKKAKRHNAMTSQLSWLSQQPLSWTFEFYNGTRMTVVHGGVCPHHQEHDLSTNVETCYVRTIDKNGKQVRLVRKVQDGKLKFEPEKPGTIWHYSYDGRFGYVVSGHTAQHDGTPKFYNYSCNLDSAVYHTGKLTGLLFSDKGKEDVLTFEGRAKFPNLDEMEKLMAQRKRL